MTTLLIMLIYVCELRPSIICYALYLLMQQYNGEHSEYAVGLHVFTVTTIFTAAYCKWIHADQ